MTLKNLEKKSKIAENKIYYIGLQFETGFLLQMSKNCYLIQNSAKKHNKIIKNSKIEKDKIYYIRLKT